MSRPGEGSSLQLVRVVARGTHGCMKAGGIPMRRRSYLYSPKSFAGETEGRQSFTPGVRTHRAERERPLELPAASGSPFAFRLRPGSQNAVIARPQFQIRKVCVRAFAPLNHTLHSSRQRRLASAGTRRADDCIKQGRYQTRRGSSNQLLLGSVRGSLKMQTVPPFLNHRLRDWQFEAGPRAVRTHRTVFPYVLRQKLSGVDPPAALLS